MPTEPTICCFVCMLIVLCLCVMCVCVCVFVYRRNQTCHTLASVFTVSITFGAHWNVHVLDSRFHDMLSPRPAFVRFRISRHLHRLPSSPTNKQPNKSRMASTTGYMDLKLRGTKDSREARGGACRGYTQVRRGARRGHARVHGASYYTPRGHIGGSRGCRGPYARVQRGYASKLQNQHKEKQLK